MRETLMNNTHNNGKYSPARYVETVLPTYKTTKKKRKHFRYSSIVTRLSVHLQYPYAQTLPSLQVSQTGDKKIYRGSHLHYEGKYGEIPSVLGSQGLEGGL